LQNGETRGDTVDIPLAKITQIDNQDDLRQAFFVWWCNHQVGMALNAMEAHALFEGALIFHVDLDKGHTNHAFPTETGEAM